MHNWLVPGSNPGGPTCEACQVSATWQAFFDRPQRLVRDSLPDLTAHPSQRVARGPDAQARPLGYLGVFDEVASVKGDQETGLDPDGRNQNRHVGLVGNHVASGGNLSGGRILDDADAAGAQGFPIEG